MKKKEFDSIVEGETIIQRVVDSSFTMEYNVLLKLDKLIVLEPIKTELETCQVVSKNQCLRVYHIKQPDPKFTVETFLTNYGKTVWAWDGNNAPEQRTLVGYNPNVENPYHTARLYDSSITGRYQHISLTDPNL